MNNDDLIVFDTGLSTEIKSEKPIKSLKLVSSDDPILKEVMPDFNFQVRTYNPMELASALVETCRDNKGYGLSANQCGIRARVFVMGADEEYVAFFNPKILENKGEAHMIEGCLTFPLLGLRITRPEEILVEYQDFHGETHQARFNGISARCFLHELDHMNGICYTDKVKPLALKSGMDKRDKALKKIATQQAYMMKAKQHGERQSKTN